MLGIDDYGADSFIGRVAHRPAQILRIELADIDGGQRKAFVRQRSIDPLGLSQANARPNEVQPASPSAPTTATEPAKNARRFMSPKWTDGAILAAPTALSRAIFKNSAQWTDQGLAAIRVACLCRLASWERST
jgi:hypothetical protein